MSWDPYLDLEHGVLRNKLGITNRGELARAEATLTAARIYELARAPIAGGYDLAHLQAIHRYVFGDVYDWAGQLRTVSIGKGSLFCLPQHLESFAVDIFGRLARTDHLRGVNRDEFVDQAAALLADINALHPFREGNGRTQRVFLGQLARETGYPIRWAAMDPVANIAASRAAHAGDNRQLRQMLDDLVAAGPDEGDPPSASAQPPLPREPRE